MGLNLCHRTERGKLEEIQELVKKDEGVNGELNGELNPSQKATLKFIMEHEGCTASEISRKTSIPFSTIDKHIRVLLKVGVIERRGSKKTGGYYPVEKSS